jgi:NAD(P)H-hydrate epimerase
MVPAPTRLSHEVVVTAATMQAIEQRLFDGGMPVAALMEKVAGRIAQWMQGQYPRDRYPRVGVLVGPGHNGGDALVAARELYHQGYGVVLHPLTDRRKPLTEAHWRYAQHLGLPSVPLADLALCDVILDGGFGFGLTRALTGAIAAAVDTLNGWDHPMISIDLPSGLHTDTGQPLGTTLRATHTLCLGLWKRGLLQDAALPWIGAAVLLPFDIPPADITAIGGAPPLHRRLIPEIAIAHLPLQRHPTIHKYRAGHVLIVAGSTRYGGAALLAGQGAIASGVGMVTLVVPDRLRLTALAQFPEALVIGAAETETGAIAALPEAVDLDRYDAIACGPGLTPESGVLATVWDSDRPLVLDADGLNGLAQRSRLGHTPRRAPTLLTPHPGEFQRLFPDAWAAAADPIAAAAAAAAASGHLILLKGARTVIAHPDGRLWSNPHSTPALARGGSGDVLTGLVGGLAAQTLVADPQSPEMALLGAALGGVWWHSMAARAIAQQRTVLGCAPSHLAAALPEALATALGP